MRILIIEDEVKIRIGIGKLIETETKHEVVGEAKNGIEGLEMFLRYKPDLIITDICMPEMDGLEMLTNIYKKGFKVHTIILSGYAEFEYAKRAIHLGVNDYLLKPISMESITEILDKMDKIIEEEIKMSESGESYLRDIYLDSQRFNEKAYLKLVHYYHLMEEDQYSIYLGYFGSASSLYRHEFEELFCSLKDKYPELICITAYMDKLQEILCFIAAKDQKEFEVDFERKIMRPYYNKDKRALWGVIHFNRLSLLHNKIKEAQELLNNGILLETKHLLKQEDTEKIHFEEYIYPMELENSLKIATCNGNGELLEESLNHFISYMNNHTFASDNVKHSYMKLYTFLANLLQEIDIKTYQQIQKLNYLKQLADSRTKCEMEELLKNAVLLIKNNQGMKEDIHNYTIKRAINYIREHYNEGITLEEVARKLEITPEYLSTLFFREMDVNFSTFLKMFRISHAKRLLKGTEKKIYEISEEVGYHDPKYFIRVFKEVQGISPKEYRQGN